MLDIATKTDIRLKKHTDRAPVVAIDLDGTLLTWTHWKGENNFGEPILSAKWALEKFKAAGWHIIVWTCRKDIEAIRLITDKYFPGLITEINEHKEWENKYGVTRKIVADLYIDDRAWPFCGTEVNWQKVIEDLERRRILYYD